MEESAKFVYHFTTSNAMWIQLFLLLKIKPTVKNLIHW